MLNNFYWGYKIKNIRAVLREKLREKITASQAEVIIMMGAGDIGSEVETIKIELNREA